MSATKSSIAAALQPSRRPAPGGGVVVPALLWLAFVGCALAAMFYVTDYRAFELTRAMSLAMAILGLNLLTGYNGQFSLGHGSFIAVGAYTAAIAADVAGMSFYATIPVAALTAFAIGFLFGLPALRLEGLYLALATFALAIATPQLLKYDAFEHWTGGVQGKFFFKPPPPEWAGALWMDWTGEALTANRWFYFLSLVGLAALMAIAWNLLRGRTGRAWMAIRDNPIAASSMGVNVARYKTLAFGVSAMFAGVAGVFAAGTTEFVAPDSFPLQLSITVLVGLVVGGLAGVPGCVIGGLFLVFGEQGAEWLSLMLQQLTGNPTRLNPGVFFGALMILLMYVMPQGVWGLFRRMGGAARGSREPFWLGALFGGLLIAVAWFASKELNAAVGGVLDALFGAGGG